MVASMIKRRRKASAPPTPGMRALAATVAVRRGELGLTQAALAEKAGVAERTVQYLESGRHLPTPVTLASIARVLGYQAAELRRIGTGEPAKAAS